MIGTLTPAYDRQYDSVDEVINGINRRQDFIFNKEGHQFHKGYISIKEMQARDKFTVLFGENPFRICTVRISLQRKAELAY